jgi:hypothetical protein
MRVTADLFSGRPNPVWELDPGQAAALAARLRALPVESEGEDTEGDEDGGLGYRGLAVSAGSGKEPGGWEELRVAGGRVVARGGGRQAVRVDADRALERWLVLTGEGRVEPPVLSVLKAETGAQ